jgi:hypothetical protein
MTRAVGEARRADEYERDRRINATCICLVGTWPTVSPEGRGNTSAAAGLQVAIFRPPGSQGRELGAGLIRARESATTASCASSRS